MSGREGGNPGVPPFLPELPCLILQKTLDTTRGYRGEGVKTASQTGSTVELGLVLEGPLSNRPPGLKTRRQLHNSGTGSIRSSGFRVRCSASALRG